MTGNLELMSDSNSREVVGKIVYYFCTAKATVFYKFKMVLIIIELNRLLFSDISYFPIN